MTEVLIAGIGSPHGADRLGWAVIEALKTVRLPVPAKLVSCRLPSELTPLLLEAPHAIVLDAMLGNGPAGTIHVLRVADLDGAGLRLSSHGLGLVEAIQLASVLGMHESRMQLLVLDVVEPEAEIEMAWVTAMLERVIEMLPEA